MDLSIIIVNWNTSELLLRCLESIYFSKPPLAFEIIVIDNGSVDDSVRAIESRYPDVQIIQNDQNLGFARANNQGLRIASGRYFMLLNSDTLVLPGSIHGLVETADQYPNVGVIGPKLLNLDGTLQESWASFPTLWSEMIGKNLRRRQPVAYAPNSYEVDWVMGACMLVRAEAVEAAGMLDEEYFMYSEETDWCFRIKRKGWKVWYLSNAEIYHVGGGSANRASLKQLVLLYRSKILFFRKNYDSRIATILRYGLIVANSFGWFRRVFLLWGKNREAVQHRMAVQSNLVWSLLRNDDPTVV